MNLRDEIDNIIGEDAYNEGAFMFDDNKMRFCFTPEELVKKRESIKELFKKWVLEIVGEDEDLLHNSEPTIYHVQGYNEAKQEIKLKIEELTND